MNATLTIHPAVDNGVTQGEPNFGGGRLTSKCTSDPVVVEIKGNSAFNHMCGCTKCWKPTGATFAMVAVAPRDNVAVTANEDKLQVVDPSATIQRHACKVCGAHMYGRIENKNHALYGWIFIHTELSPTSAYKAAIARMQKSFTMHQLLGQTRRPEGNSAVTFANALSRFAEMGFIAMARRGRGGREQVVLPGSAITDLAILERRLAESRSVGAVAADRHFVPLAAPQSARGGDSG